MKEGYDILSEKLEDLNDTIGRVHEEVEIQNVSRSRVFFIYYSFRSIHCIFHEHTGHVGTSECRCSSNKKCYGHINGQNKGILTDNR